MDKKAILKKYTGQGGIVKDTIKAIPGTLKGMGKSLMKGKVLDAIDPGKIRTLPWKGLKAMGKGVERAMKIESDMQKAKEAPYKQKLEDDMAGRQRYNGIEDDISRIHDRNKKILKMKK